MTYRFYQPKKDRSVVKTVVYFLVTAPVGRSARSTCSTGPNGSRSPSPATGSSSTPTGRSSTSLKSGSRRTERFPAKRPREKVGGPGAEAPGPWARPYGPPLGGLGGVGPCGGGSPWDDGTCWLYPPTRRPPDFRRDQLRYSTTPTDPTAATATSPTTRSGRIDPATPPVEPPPQLPCRHEASVLGRRDALRAGPGRSPGTGSDRLGRRRGHRGARREALVLTLVARRRSDDLDRVGRGVEGEVETVGRDRLATDVRAREYVAAGPEDLEAVGHQDEPVDVVERTGDLDRDHRDRAAVRERHGPEVGPDQGDRTGAGDAAVGVPGPARVDPEEARVAPLVCERPRPARRVGGGRVPRRAGREVPRHETERRRERHGALRAAARVEVARRGLAEVGQRVRLRQVRRAPGGGVVDPDRAHGRTVLVHLGGRAQIREPGLGLMALDRQVAGGPRAVVLREEVGRHRPLGLEFHGARARVRRGVDHLPAEERVRLVRRVPQLRGDVHPLFAAVRPLLARRRARGGRRAGSGDGGGARRRGEHREDQVPSPRRRRASPTCPSFVRFAAFRSPVGPPLAVPNEASPVFRHKPPSREVGGSRDGVLGRRSRGSGHRPANGRSVTPGIQNLAVLATSSEVSYPASVCRATPSPGSL